MKKILFYLASILFLSNCASSKKSLERAQFDSAVRISVSKLRKDPANVKELDILKQSYGKANQIDIDRINFLKTSGEPNIWDNIFNLYNGLKNRQDLVKTLPNNILNELNFVPVNYDQEVINAKKNAAEFYYQHGLSLLAKNDRQSAREALADLQRVKGFYPDYKEVDAKMQEAVFKGTNNILFKIQNQTNIILPKNFEDELLKISMDELNAQWLNYDTRPVNDLFYDYSITLNIKDIAVSPELSKEQTHTEEKEVPNGFKYKMDAKGNVMKDTAGNDIKIPIIKVITCQVNEVFQSKSAIITGTLDYINNRTGQLIKTNPITTETGFNNHACLAVGNLDALKPETRKMIGTPVLPFPSSPDLIMQTGLRLKEMTKDIIYANKGLITY